MRQFRTGKRAKKEGKFEIAKVLDGSALKSARRIKFIRKHQYNNNALE
jgi:hypothetical protein